MIEFLGCFSVLISTKNGVVKVQLEKKETKKKNLSFCALFCHVKHFDTPMCQSNNNIKTPLAHVTEMTM